MKKKHKLKLQSCYSRSPFFKDYFPLIEKIYDSDYNNLADFNYEFITFLNKSFNINTEIIKSSNINIKESLFSSRFLSEAVRKVGGDTYLSGPSGSDYINKKDFESNCIKLIFQKYRCKDYKQIFPGFVSNLSAIDLLFNMGPDSQNFV